MRDKICGYYPCPVAEITGRNCADFERCPAKLFLYDKFVDKVSSEEEEYLGVGAPMVALWKLGYGGIEGEVDSQKNKLNAPLSKDI